MAEGVAGVDGAGRADCDVILNMAWYKGTVRLESES